ncbi:ABC transporter permease [Rhodobaculum claviforme]|uniref:Transport permease protein n=1 Tax=Rhodobaculum claviforme TaxID=1549854 RepID=A0A934TM12_9RHOB|nr:ABC transporter permease [Rhodobaculum claviforme]MBK5928014.1 sugar ABC transporter permease [Rhodobaculum claviforme]
MTRAHPDPLRRRHFQRTRSVLALMLREMSTRYGRSPGGYAWTILEPVGGVAILILILVLGLRIRNPSLGISFPIFYATGVLSLLFYRRISDVVAGAITFSRALLAYPGVTFVDTLLARFLVQTVTGLTVMYIVFAGSILLFETRTLLDLPQILLAVAMAAVLGLGIGCLNAYLFPTFPLWESFWNILTFPLFLVSGVFFIYEDLPPIGQQILWYNPLIHITGQMRVGFYPTYDPSYISPAYVFAVGLVPMVLGLMLLRRHYKRIINL